MSNELQTMQSWQVFHAARKYIGAERVARLFNREKRSAYNWAQNPSYTQHRCKNPLDTLHALFVELDTHGLGYVVENALVFLQSSIHDIDQEGPLKEPMASMTDQLLANFTTLSTLKEAIERQQSADAVVALGKEAEAEIQRTVARYIQDTEK